MNRSVILTNNEDFHHELLKKLLLISPISKIEITIEVKQAVEMILQELDDGKISVAQHINGEWITNQHIKLAILLAFRIKESYLMSDKSDFQNIVFDRFQSKFHKWTEEDFRKINIRIAPNCFIRHSVFVGKNVVMMPSFVNVGASVGDNTMIDSWSTVGSCAHIGKNVHISGGVGIGGVLEPLQANPTIVEDDCFIGARSEICEGVIVGKGSVISMGCYIGQSTKIIHRDTGEVLCGKIPPYSVVVPGNYSYPQNPSLSGYCVIIIKQVDENTRRKTSINELLR